MGLFDFLKKSYKKKLKWGSYRFPDNVTGSLVKKINKTDDQQYLSAFILACFKKSPEIDIRNFDPVKSKLGDKHRYMLERDILAAVAISRITDQTLLAEMAKNVCCQVDLGLHGIYTTIFLLRLEVAATQRLTTEELLCDVAMNAVSRYAVEAAIIKLSDRKSHDAGNHKIEAIRQKAIQRLTDETLLADNAKNGEKTTVRKVVVVNLTDQEVLESIANYTAKGDVRKKQK
ncbi:MAG: hypothetical protein LBE91_21800 [Tannerella sp.]|nr:hypothetical protein [Tannerella sp.]